MGNTRAVVRIQWQMGKRLVAVEKETTLITDRGY